MLIYRGTKHIGLFCYSSIVSRGFANFARYGGHYSSSSNARRFSSSPSNDKIDKILDIVTKTDERSKQNTKLGKSVFFGFITGTMIYVFYGYRQLR